MMQQLHRRYFLRSLEPYQHFAGLGHSAQERWLHGCVVFDTQARVSVRAHIAGDVNRVDSDEPRAIAGQREQYRWRAPLLRMMQASKRSEDHWRCMHRQNILPDRREVVASGMNRQHVRQVALLQHRIAGIDHSAAIGCAMGTDLSEPLRLAGARPLPRLSSQRPEAAVGGARLAVAIVVVRMFECVSFCKAHQLMKLGAERQQLHTQS